MSKNLLVINCDIRETRVALIENGIIAEFHIERANQEKCLGDVVLGKVSRVLPGMQAAFIDVGLDKAAFLHVEDLIRPDDFEGYLTGRRKTERAQDEDPPSEEDIPKTSSASPATPSAREPHRDSGRDAGQSQASGKQPGERPGRRRQRLDTSKIAAPVVPPPPPTAASGVVVPPPPASSVVPSSPPPPPSAPAQAHEALPSAKAEATPAAIASPTESSSSAPEAIGAPAPAPFDVEVVAAAPEPASSVIVAMPPPPAPTVTDVPGFGFEFGSPIAVPAAAESVVALSIDRAPSPSTDTDSSDNDEDGGEDGENDGDSDVGEETATQAADGEAPAQGEGSKRGARRGRRRRRGRRDDGKAEAAPAPAPAPSPAPQAPSGSHQQRQGGRNENREGRRHQGGQGGGQGNQGGRDRDRSDRGDRGDRHDHGHSHGPSGHGRIDKHTPIREVVREGQEVLVQITKEPIGTKGARVSSHVSLPGRYVVYLPTVEYVGVSKRIGSEKERQRLREAIESMRPPSGGLIVRTVAEGLTKKQLKQDVGYLVRLWGEIAKMKEGARGVSLLYKELDLVLKVARDMFTDDIGQIVIDDRAQYERLVRFVEMFMPERVKDVLFYQGDEPIFDAYGIEEEISRSLARKVPLPSGGYLIIDEAEALTAIDVNTGRFVGKGSKDHEDTIVKTNMEAVQEIAYQLRFRNLGGLIVLDLIDMERPSSREAVRRRLEDLLQKDKAKTSLNRISDLGLIEMTRKRTSESLGRVLHEPCFYCDGTGQISSKTTVVYEILRAIRRDRSNLPGYTVIVNAHPEVVSLMKGEERQAVQECEKRFQRRIDLMPRKEYHLEQFDLLGR
jgi:ribonuclease G